VLEVTNEERIVFVKGIISKFVPEIARTQEVVQEAITDEARKIVDRWETDIHGRDDNDRPTRVRNVRIGLQDMLETLYNLEPWELRRLAWEALLISDGPDKVGGQQGGSISVAYQNMNEGFRVRGPSL